MSKLAKKVALVTGGSRGIGAAIAKRLAADGASVAITYAKDASAASAVVKAIELGGGKAIAIQADAANVEAVKNAVEKAVATFGRLDVLVNNAGTAIPKTFEETTVRPWASAPLRPDLCPTRPRREPSRCLPRRYPERSGAGALQSTTSSRVRSIRI